MDSNRIKDIDARHGTQDENGNGAKDAAMRKMGKEVQDLAGGGAAERKSLERVKTEGLVKKRGMECVVARDRGQDGREVTAG